MFSEISLNINKELVCSNSVLYNATCPDLVGTPLCNRPSGIFIPTGFSKKPSLGWLISHWVGFINQIRIVAAFLLLLFFCSFAKIRWVCKSHTEQSLGKHENGRVKSKYSLGTGEAKFPLGKGK